MSHFVTKPIIESVTAIKEPSISYFQDEDSLENEEDIDDRVGEIVTFACSGCVIDFPDKNSLVKHVQEIHKGLKIKDPSTSHFKDEDTLEDGNTFEDDDTFENEGEGLKMKEPSASHSKDEDILENEDDIDDSVGEKVTFACSDCVVDFPDKKSLEKHVRVVHKGLKIHTCEFCQKEFFYKSHFDIHLRFHTGERPYSCKICYKKCTTSFDFKAHVLSHNKERRFECYVCELRFNNKSTLKKHFRTHTGEKPFVCPICNKEFSQSNSLKYHVSTHQTEDFVCNICDKTFSEKYRYDYHLRTHDPNYNNGL